MKLPLGERCIALARSEMAAGVKAAPYGQPNTGPRVREYLAGCERNGKLLGLTQGNWCAAFCSWVLEQTILPGEERPHGYRAAVVEMVEDAHKLGRWIPVEAVRAGEQTPNIGDPAIWDRTEGPGTEWQRHVNRVVSWDVRDPATLGDDLFMTIGGNEVRTIIETRDRPKELSAGKLLGFISYAQEPPAPPELLDDAERERIQGLISLALYEIGTVGGRPEEHDTLTETPVAKSKSSQSLRAVKP